MYVCRHEEECQAQLRAKDEELSRVQQPWTVTANEAQYECLQQQMAHKEQQLQRLYHKVSDLQRCVLHCFAVLCCALCECVYELSKFRNAKRPQCYGCFVPVCRMPRLFHFSTGVGVADPPPFPCKPPLKILGQYFLRRLWWQVSVVTVSFYP